MTAVDVKIGADWYYNLSDWSVVGDSSPLIPGDMTGGAGTMSFTLPEGADSRMLQGRACSLHDPAYGDTSGNLRLAGGNMVNATITGYSKIAALNVTRTATGYNGTLRGAILYYLGLCGVTTNIAVDSSIASRAVRVIGWQGNVLDRIKDLCAAQNMDLSLVGEMYVFRAAMARQITTRSFADYTWAASEDQLAQKVKVAWYNTGAPASQLIYPVGGWNDDLPVFQVDASATAVYEIDLKPTLEEGQAEGVGMSALTVSQPTCVASVPREYTGTSSAYTVTGGSDGLPVTPAQWNAGGGSVKVEILDGGSRLKVTIVGPGDEKFAPYQIAMASGTSDTYSSLRIRGTGMLYTYGIVEMATGLDEDRAPQEEASLIDSPFFSSYEAAWKAASALSSRHAAARYTIQGTLGQIDTYAAPTVTYFDGQSVPGDPAAHPFGNLEGSYFIDGGTVFRIRSVTYTPTGGTFTAEQHATSDASIAALKLATGASTMTATQWNAYYPAGMTADQYNAAPLKGYTL